MNFAQAVKKELRDAFGPQWVSTAASYAVLVAGLFLVGSFGLELMKTAMDIGTTLEGQMK